MTKAGSPALNCTCTTTARASSPRQATVATVATISGYSPQRGIA
jgi:hypothetical protein